MAPQSQHLFAEAEPVAMSIGSLVPWFGSKRTLAPRIVKELGPHRAYWEPCCGSMAVLFAKPPATMETVNDLHGDLINLARVVKHDDLSFRLFERMNREMMHEEVFTEAAARYRERGNRPAGDEPDLDRAADYLLSSWQGRNGVAGTQSYNQGYCSRYTANGGHAATRWRRVVESIPAWWERLRNVTVLNRDMFGLLERIDDAPGTAIYVDPPYMVKGANYVHDFVPADHERLAEALARFKLARVVVSYYEHPEVRRLYQAGRWTFVECDMRKSLSNAGMRGEEVKEARAMERLIVNGESFTTEVDT